METSNMKTKISSVKALFNNIRDTLFREEINKIRTNIYKKEAISDYLNAKDKLTSKDSKSFNKIHAYFNKQQEDLLKKNKYQENTIY